MSVQPEWAAQRRAGRAGLNGWRIAGMGTAVGVVVVLVLVGVARRSAEYR